MSRISRRGAPWTFLRLKVLNFLQFYVGIRHMLPANAEASMDTAYLSQNRKLGLRNLDTDFDNACAEFDNKVPIGSGWHHSDCVTVWNGWFAPAVKRYSISPYPREMFTEMSTKLRQRGSPCLVESIKYPAGAGSSATQYLETWMFAEEMGCDWILPRPPPKSYSVDGDGSSLYCHLMVSRDTMHLLMENKEWKNGDIQLSRCKAINWSQFFHYNAHAVMNTFDGTTKRVEVSKDEYPESLQEAVDEYRLHAAEDNLPWDHLLFHLGARSANMIFQLPASWDNFKRNTTRDVLRKYREGFHQFPRPWFDNQPTCMYTSSPQELNFAIHIRLGDRTSVQQGFESGYENYIKTFMDTVTAAVTRRGLDTPMFHVFSETSLPCPTEMNGTFPEFPAWPVDTYQIEPCLNPIAPEDCPEKRAGASSCNPKQSGIFRVMEKPLYLHVGFDVQNEITCMAKADGILMGCSTFGQTPGVLNKGLKFFSFECGGKNTPGHNNMMPLLAIAERGNLWVPVAGSWRDPSIMSEVIFEAALDEHLKNKQVELTDG